MNAKATQPARARRKRAQRLADGTRIVIVMPTAEWWARLAVDYDRSMSMAVVEGV